MERTKSTLKKITSLFLSFVFAISSFAVVGFSNSTAETAQAAVDDDYYFMSYFTGNGRASDGWTKWGTDINATQATRFAVSSDGVHFSALDKNRPVLDQVGGTHNSRDHYTFKGQDGKYYILATDADYSDWEWSKECNGFVLWRSDDLLTWEEKIIDLHDVTGLGDKFLNYAWAPEIIWDSDLNKYIIYFALQSEGVTKYQQQMMYYIATTDLWDVTKWEYPQLLYDYPTPCIDANITYSPTDDTYYMFYKNEASHAICLATADYAHGPYTYFGLLSTTIATGGLEGCQVYMKGNEYYLFADRYAKGLGNFAIYNLGTDLSKLTTKTDTIYWEETINDEIVVQSEVRNDVLCLRSGDTTESIGIVDAMTGFGNLSPRHGSIIHISKSQYKALLAKYTGSDGNDDIRYDFSRSYTNYYNDKWNRWTWDEYLDTSGHKIILNGRNDSDSEIAIPANGGYASICDSWICADGNSAPEVTAMFPDDVYTIDFNFTLDVAGSDDGTVFSLGTPSADYLRLCENGDIYYRGSGASSDTKMGTTSIKEGINYHFTFVSDGSSITVYKNGKKVCFANTTIDFPTSGDRFAGFGYSDTHTSKVTGTYYDIRFINRALSVQEAENQYKPNLAYRYNAGTTTKDSRNNVSDVTTKTRVTDYEGATNCHDVTVSCMYNPGDSLARSGDYCIYEVGAGGTNNSKTYFNLLGNGHIYYCWGDGSTVHYFDVASSNVFGSALTANTWYHLTTVVHFDEINTRYLIMVYVNGTRTFSSTFSVTNFSTSYTVDKYFSQSRQVWIGGGNAHWPENSGGYLDDLRIYGSKSIDPEALYEEYQEEYINEGYAEQAEEARTYVRANLESYDADTYRAAYHYTNDAEGGYSNVVASSYNDMAYNNVWDVWQNNTSYAYFYPKNIVLAYDGSSRTPALPVQTEIKNRVESGAKDIATMYAYNGSDGVASTTFKLAHYWTGGVTGSHTTWYGTSMPYNYKDFPQGGSDKTEINDGYNHLGYYPGATWDYNWILPGENYDTSYFFWNKLYYIGDANTIGSDYKETYTTTPIQPYQAGHRTVPSATHNVYIINFKPIYDILKADSPTAVPNADGFGSLGLKNFYTYYVKNSESNYTEDSLNQFYVAAYKVLKAAPLYYSEETYRSDFSGTVDLAAANIADAIEEFAKINLVKRADFSTLDTAYSNANAVIATLGTNNQAKTTSSINALKEVVDAISYEPADNDFRKNAASSLYDNDIETEAAKITAKINALDTIFNFDTAYEYNATTWPVTTMDVVDGGSPASYNRMKTMAATAIAKLGAEDQNKTTSSLTTLKSAYDALTYDSYTTEQKRDLGVKKDGAAIAAQIDAVADKYLLLEDLLSYEIVDEKYAAGDEFLQSIKGKEAQYKASSIQAILDAMDAASADVDDTSAERLDNAYSSVKQTAIDDRGRAITTAIDNLSDAENANYIDVSAYTPALNKITHLDNDAYKENGEGSIAKAISNATTVLVTTSTKTYDGGTINVIDSSVEQENVDDATSAILAALYTCVRTYDVTATDGVEISGNSGRIEDGKASYGTKVNFDSSDANTAWYMSYDSASTSRNEQYLGYGSRVSTTVLGDMNVTAVTKSVSTPNLLTINRSYSDNSSTHGVTLKTYVGSTYTLPAAPAIAYYTFANYSYNGGTYNAGDTITVTNKNATVTANYTKAGGNAYTVKISSVSGNGDLYNQSASYNTKIEKSADGAYGWVKVDGGKETVYSVGSDLTYFVYDSIELKAVATKPTGYTGVPTVYLRESGLVKTPFTDGSGKTKLTINGNYVTDGYEIVEYGVLLGKATTGTITDDDVVVENSSNTDGFKVLRAKATKTVGANQFTIAVNLPSSFTGAFKYRGYVMYKDGTEIKTVYTDVENESI